MANKDETDDYTSESEDDTARVRLLHYQHCYCLSTKLCRQQLSLMITFFPGNYRRIRASMAKDVGSFEIQRP